MIRLQPESCLSFWADCKRQPAQNPWLFCFTSSCNRHCMQVVLEQSNQDYSAQLILSTGEQEELQWWLDCQLASSPGLSQILFHSRGERSEREDTIWEWPWDEASHQAPDEKVMKTLSQCLETSLHRKHTTSYRRKLRSIRLLCKMRRKTDSQKMLVKLETSSYTAMYIYTLLFTQPRLQLQM